MEIPKKVKRCLTILIAAASLSGIGGFLLGRNNNGFSNTEAVDTAITILHRIPQAANYVTDVIGSCIEDNPEALELAGFLREDSHLIYALFASYIQRPDAVCNDLNAAHKSIDFLVRVTSNYSDPLLLANIINAISQNNLAEDITALPTELVFEAANAAIRTTFNGDIYFNADTFTKSINAVSSSPVLRTFFADGTAALSLFLRSATPEQKNFILNFLSQSTLAGEEFAIPNVNPTELDPIITFKGIAPTNYLEVVSMAAQAFEGIARDLQVAENPMASRAARVALNAVMEAFVHDGGIDTLRTFRDTIPAHEAKSSNPDFRQSIDYIINRLEAHWQGEELTATVQELQGHIALVWAFAETDQIEHKADEALSTLAFAVNLAAAQSPDTAPG